MQRCKLKRYRNNKQVSPLPFCDMIAVLAEKPSVAREIATVLGATKKNDGYLEGNGYVVTWAFGHLIELAAPAAYGYVGFKADNLPILPDAFQYTVRQTGSGKDAHVDSGARKQLGVIKDRKEQP